MKITMKQAVSLVSGAMVTHSAIVNSKSQNPMTNPYFGATSTVLFNDAFESGNTMALAEIGRRAKRNGVSVDEFINSKIGKANRAAMKAAAKEAATVAKKAAKQAPAPVAPAPVSIQGWTPEVVQALLSFIQQQQVSVAKEAATAPVVEAPANPALQRNCIKAAAEAIKTGDRSALKAELVNLGVVEASSKLRLAALIELFDKKFGAKVTKHAPAASAPKVPASADMSIGTIQFVD